VVRVVVLDQVLIRQILVQTALSIKDLRVAILSLGVLFQATDKVLVVVVRQQLVAMK
jgi:hypothetical protein